MLSYLKRLVVVASIISSIFPLAAAEEIRTINVGYFEAGPYAVSKLLRNEYFRYLQQLLPPEVKAVAVPQGYRSAEWHKDSCGILAAELTRVKNIDLMVAVGPWVVQELLASGFDKPIVALHQFDASAEGLVDSLNRPVRANLTVNYDPNRIRDDLFFLRKLANVDRLAFLYFPSGDESARVLEKVRRVGGELGFEVISADGYDINGAFAFFKAYHQIRHQATAIYLPPLWGLKDDMLTPFFDMLKDDRLPSMISDGKLILEHGAFATSNYNDVTSEAYFSAWKTVEIVKGKRPSSLPVVFQSGNGLAINNETARRCQISLPEDVLNDFFTVPAKATDDTPLLTLAEAVHRATQQYPGYLAQAEAVKAAEAAARQTYSAYFPQLYGLASYTHVDDNTVENFRNTLDKEQYLTELRFDQQLFSLETVRRIESAAKRKDISEANQSTAQLDLELVVSIAYLNLLKARETAQLYQNNRQLVDYFLELAAARQQTGSGDTLDIVRLEDTRYQLTEKYTTAKGDAEVGRVILNTLLNFPGDRAILLDTASFSDNYFWSREAPLLTLLATDDGQKKIGARLLNYALAQNSLTKSVDLRLSLQKSLIAENTARYFPTIGFRASLAFTDRLQNTQFLGQDFEEQHNTWSIGAFVTLPIFLGGSRIHERANLNAEYRKLEYDRDDIDLDIMRRVLSAQQELAAAASRAVPAARGQLKAQESVNLVTNDYSAGRHSYLNLLDIQSSLLQNDLALLNARHDYYLAGAQLVNLTGLSVGEDFTHFADRLRQFLTNK